MTDSGLSRNDYAQWLGYVTSLLKIIGIGLTEASVAS